MTQYTDIFDYGFSTGALVDIGKSRHSNQDEVIICPDMGFYAISDGMGGLENGGKTSRETKEKLPQKVKDISTNPAIRQTPEYAAKLLTGEIGKLSDYIFERDNSGYGFKSGATLSAVW
jgi:serine/threonine protein phosphatase PrpC